MATSGCSSPAGDGTYIAHIQGSVVQLSLPTSSGTLTTLAFRPATINAYNAAVLSVRLLVQQTNALESYVVGVEPSQVFFQPGASRIFKIGSSWYVLVTQQTNSVADHAQAVDKLSILKWLNGGWEPVDSYPLSSDVGPIPGTPFTMNLGRGVTGYGVPLLWMQYLSYEVVAYVNGRWRLVGFDTDAKLSPKFITNSDEMSGKGPTVIRTLKSCSAPACPTATITYTFMPTSGTRGGGPIFAITGLSGPKSAFVQH